MADIYYFLKEAHDVLAIKLIALTPAKYSMREDKENFASLGNKLFGSL